MACIRRTRRASKRCDIMVRAGTYRAPGQCLKNKNLKTVIIGGVKVLVCPHHKGMIGRVEIAA